MCLTGVDYFSTLGYQPGIAVLAAGALAPVATFFLVLVTLFVAYPIYALVAAKSPHGQGSIEMLQRLLPRWRGKLVVLILLGFAFTDFIITITLSAADSTAHIIENPFVPHAFHYPVAITLVLLALLSVVFLRGFREAIGFAVLIVAVYMAMNLVLLGVAIYEVLIHPEVLPRWREALVTAHGSPWRMLGMALLLFPRLALGLSGFETGVSVMPLVQGSGDDDPERPRVRIRNTRKLLFSAALTMSVLLMASSITTTLLIPAAAFEKGGEANGRALAYLAHTYLGPTFGTAVRPQHHRHPLVRGGLRHGCPAEPGAAIPAALRHGARLGAGQPAARARVHGRDLRGHDRLPGRRHGPGRGLRHRSARAHDLGLPGRDHRSLGRADAVDLSAHDPRLHLHPGGQHPRAARGHQDRVVLHRVHRHRLAHVAGATLHGAAHRQGGAVGPRGGLRGRGRALRHPPHRPSARQAHGGGVRPQGAAGPRRPQPRQGRAPPVPRGHGRATPRTSWRA